VAVKPRIHEPDDKPVLNQFGLPVICNDLADEASDPCCEPCSDWMYCLLQAFYTVDIPDPIEFENWLADHWLSGNVQHKADQGLLHFSAASGEPTAIFQGTFLAEPPNQEIAAQACEFPQREDSCNHTHRIRHERTVLTDSNEANLVKRFGLNVNTECVQVGEDKFIRFTLNLVYEAQPNVALYEPPIGYDVDEETDLGIYCAPKPRTPWDAIYQDPKLWCCCPLAVSDLIDVTTISSLADLAAVVLNKLPPAHATYEAVLYGVWVGDGEPTQRCLQTCGVWACSTSNLMIECASGNPVCLYWPHDVCHYYVNGTDVDPWYPWGVGEDCATNGSGVDLCDGEVIGCTTAEYNGGSSTPGSGTCNTSLCISRPLEFGLGDIVLSVIDNKCQLATDCKACFPDPESPVAIPIKPGDVKFATDSASNSCAKVFHIVKPDCLTVDKVFWSDGTITLGTATHTVEINNLEEDSPSRLSQKVSALILMTNGCYYCWEETFSCGCCEGVSGSISIADDPENECRFTITANVTSTVECPLAFIEFQVIKPGSGGPCDLAEFPECECEQVVPGNTEDPPCPSYAAGCTYGLSDGQSAVVIVTGETIIRYRIVDGPCGCASDWIETPITCSICECCEGTVYSIVMTIAGWTSVMGTCPECESVNRSYTLLPVVIGVNCLWRYEERPAFDCPFEETPGPTDIVAEFNAICGELMGDPGEDLWGLATLDAGATAQWSKYVIDTPAIPYDCENLLTGFYKLEDFSYNPAFGCDPTGATCHIEVLTA
jgi:hypothetical protein